MNRTEANPLEVYVLADVAVPLVFERLTTWDVERPDVVQRMLLAGFVVNSPADAALLHPELFYSAEQARKAMDRAAFNGQNPIGTCYREMSVKSAGYRRAGRGRGWQRIWWIEGEESAIRQRVEASLGRLAGWEPA